MDYTRQIAAVLVAAALIATVLHPRESKDVAVMAAAGASAFDRTPTAMATRACPIAGSVLTAPVANIDDVISVSPLGGVTAPEEPLPAPHIRINTKRAEAGFDRRETSVFAPAKADIVAIERRIRRNLDGTGVGQSWTVYLSVCEDVSLFIDDLDSISPSIIRAAGGVKAFTNIDGADHTAVKTQIRVRAGEEIGRADGFDMGLSDRGRAPKNLVRPARYQTNPYVKARALNADPELVAALSHDHARAQCPLDYYSPKIAEAWSARLGDAFGMRRAKGDNACRTAVLDMPGTAQGAWFTDAALNAAVSKVSAVSLAPDTIDPKRQIFALHGRLPSLSPKMVNLTPKQVKAREEAARDFLSFARKRGAGQNQGNVNTAFALTKPGETYCYEGLRANFIGPRINGVMLLRVEEPTDTHAGATNGDGAQTGVRMRIEARSDAQSCTDLATPWAFSGDETIFFR
ncbi:MAG: hypothetical protein AAF224_11675 [Pseudomonadota bacterium]